MLCMGSEKNELVYLNMSYLIYMLRLYNIHERLDMLRLDYKKMRFWHASNKGK